jgi:hypothetical protein
LVAADAKNFYACNIQVYTGESDGVWEKKQGLRVVKDMVCHMHGTRRGVTTENFFASCELVNFLLTKNMTVFGTLRKNKPEISTLFPSGKQRDVHSSIFGSTNELTLVPYVPARNKTVILLSSQHHDDTYKGEKKDNTPEIIMHCNATKSRADILDKLVKEYFFMVLAFETIPQLD